MIEAPPQILFDGRCNKRSYCHILGKNYYDPCKILGRRSHAVLYVILITLSHQEFFAQFRLKLTKCRWQGSGPVIIHRSFN